MAALRAVEMRTSRHFLEKNREADPVIAENSLLKRYGPLMNLADLASMLDRSPDGLRVTLRSSGEWVDKINGARLQLGRRVYFRTAEIAEALAPLPDWTYKAPNIEAAFAFANFRDAISFIVQVAIEAEASNHHPEFHNSWNKVTFSFCTHDVGNKITDTDIKLAERLNVPLIIAAGRAKPIEVDTVEESEDVESGDDQEGQSPTPKKAAPAPKKSTSPSSKPMRAANATFSSSLKNLTMGDSQTPSLSRM